MAKMKKGSLKSLELVLRASMFCLGLATMVVLAVVFVLVIVTMLAATVVPERDREGKRGGRTATPRKASGWKRVWAS